jgi:hypothetical protein
MRRVIFPLLLLALAAAAHGRDLSKEWGPIQTGKVIFGASGGTTATTELTKTGLDTLSTRAAAGNDAATTVSANKAKWDSAHTSAAVFTGAKAGYDSARTTATTFTSNKAKYDSAWSSMSLGKAGWDAAVTTAASFNSNKARYDSAHSTAALATAGMSRWDNAYDYAFRPLYATMGVMQPFRITNNWPAIITGIFDTAQNFNIQGSIPSNFCRLAPSGGDAVLIKTLPSSPSKIFSLQAYGARYAAGEHCPAVGSVFSMSMLDASGNALVTLKYTYGDMSGTEDSSSMLTVCTNTDPTGASVQVSGLSNSATVYNYLDLHADPATYKANASVAHQTVSPADGMAGKESWPVAAADLDYTGTIAKVEWRLELTTGTGSHVLQSVAYAEDPYVQIGDSITGNYFYGVGVQSYTQPQSGLAMPYVYHGKGGIRVLSGTADALMTATDGIANYKRTTYLQGYRRIILGNIGTNDFAVSGDENLTDVKAAYASILADLDGQGLRDVVVCAMCPRGPSSARDTATIAAVREANAYLAALAAQYGFKFYDAYATMADGITDNFVAGYSSDGVHPNLFYGSTRLAAGLYGAINRPAQVDFLDRYSIGANSYFVRADMANLARFMQVMRGVSGIAVGDGLGGFTATADNHLTWDKAMQWDGSDTGITSETAKAAARTSLGLGDTSTPVFGGLTLGSSAAGVRSLLLYSDTANKYLTIATLAGGPSSITATGNDLRLFAGANLSAQSASNGGFYLDAGSLGFNFRNQASSDAVIATLNNATGAMDIGKGATPGGLSINGTARLGADGSASLTTATLSAALKLAPLASAPSAVEGTIYAATDHHLYYHNGTAWVQLDN